MMEVTLHLPDHLYEQAKQWAAITQRNMDEALTDALAVVLTPVYSMPELDQPISSLSDAEVLAQTMLQLEDKQGQRLNALLHQQREGQLTGDTQRELMALFHLYQRLWLRQSEALTEAVRRQLRPPLTR